MEKDLSKQEFENEVFKKDSFASLDLKHKMFSSVTFDHCDFTKTDLRNACFQDCQFLFCSVNLSQLDGSRWQKVAFENCKLIGVNFSGCEKKFFSIRPLSKLHFIVKTALFGIFVTKFFDHMYSYALQNFATNLHKNCKFFQQKQASKEVYFKSVSSIRPIFLVWI